MVALITSSSLNYQEKTSNPPANASSRIAEQSDPDLLIREYFLSSSSQRAASRQRIIKLIVKHPNPLLSIFAILSWGASGKARDGYDAAVNLLAEIDRFSLLKAASEAAAATYPPLLQNPVNINFAESSLEILIKAIACAYKINATQRLRLLTKGLPKIDRRIIKTSIIDALIILADDVDRTQIKDAIASFSTDHDPYIRDYATTALQDIG